MSNFIRPVSRHAVLRPLSSDDLPALLQIQLACYGPGFIESADVYARRLASPVNCSLGCELDGQLCAYLAAYRSVQGKVTPLHGDFLVSPVVPDTLYVHDMAVAPTQGGQGIAHALLELLFAQGRAAGLHHSALVSVQGTQAYWARHGYVAQPLGDAGEELQLSGYGGGAVYMMRPLASV